MGLRWFLGLAVVDLAFAVGLALGYAAAHPACPPPSFACAFPGVLCPPVCGDALAQMPEVFLYGIQLGLLPGFLAAGLLRTLERRRAPPPGPVGSWLLFVGTGIVSLGVSAWAFLGPFQLRALTWLFAFLAASGLVALFALAFEATRRGVARYL